MTSESPVLAGPEANRRLPLVVVKPTTLAHRSLMAKGTPRNGPGGSPSSLARRAWSSKTVTTAFTVGLVDSIEARAWSSSSWAETSPPPTNSAKPRASCWPTRFTALASGPVDRRRSQASGPADRWRSAGDGPAERWGSGRDRRARPVLDGSTQGLVGVLG